MGTVDLSLAADLRARLGVGRAIETGTFRGSTARHLATVFPEVVTIELSADLHRSAQAALRDTPRVRAVQGHSVERLRELTDADRPSLFFLDGHWSGGNTGGSEDECPVLAELAAIGAGHADDCLIVDDARMFTSAPPPPHKAEQWPTLIEVFDAIRERHPDHLVTLLDDQVVAVPSRARPAIDAYGGRLRHGQGIAGRLPALWARGRAEVTDRLRVLRAR